MKSCVKDFGQTLVMITHDETIAQMADRIVEIEDGKIFKAQGGGRSSKAVIE